MNMGVGDFAAAKGLSSRRVLQLIEQGDIKARKISNRWIIGPQELSLRPKASRPFSRKMSLSMLELLSGQAFSQHLDPAEARRLRIRFSQLQEHRDPASLLRSWIRFDSEPIELFARKVELAKLRKSSLIMASGASHPLSGMSDGDSFEAYVEKKYLQKIKKEFLLVNSEEPNIFLKVIDKPFPQELLFGLVLSDLAAKNGPRERNIVKELVQKLSSQ
jgi:hypothetical protein